MSLKVGRATVRERVTTQTELFVVLDSQLDAYKRGAFLEKADRFTKEKLLDVPGRHFLHLMLGDLNRRVIFQDPAHMTPTMWSQGTR